VVLAQYLRTVGSDGPPTYEFVIDPATLALSIIQAGDNGEFRT
jgi:hypothetical protein